MIAEAVCTECHRAGNTCIVSVPSTTERWIHCTCPNNHETVMLFQTPGWGRLYERALRRIALHHPRDAVIDAYTAFEMYLADVPVHARYEREEGTTLRKLREEMKPVTKRAENAIGAARCAVSIVSGGPPLSWKEDITANVRNEAVHGGIYPTELRAEKLCVE